MSFHKRIAVFCGSSAGAKPEYAAAAERLGELIGDQGRTLVFGGCLDGLMAILAASARKHGAAVCSEFVRSLYRESDHLPEARETFHENVRERKHGLIEQCDACIMMPGGMGTLDEFTDVCAAMQIGETKRVLGILNTAGYYDPLLAFFTRMRAEGFLSAQWDRLYVTADTPEELLELLDGIQ